LNEIRKVVTSETIEEGKRRDPRLDERSVNAVIQQKLIRIVIQARIYLQSMEDLYNAVRKQDLGGSKTIIGQLGNDLVFFVDCCGELMTKEEKSYVTETTDKHITKANEIFGKPDSSSSLIYEQYEKLPKNIVGIIDNIISRIQHNITELKNTSPLENPEENPTSNLPSLDIEKTLEQTPTSDPVKTLDQSNCCEPNAKRETKKKKKTTIYLHPKLLHSPCPPQPLPLLYHLMQKGNLKEGNIKNTPCPPEPIPSLKSLQRTES